MPRISVLRLGHRVKRDARVTTHCALVARAFGASCFIFTGDRDEKLIETVKDVCRRWGGKFEIKHESSWKAFIKNFRGIKVHLTMYGIPLPEKIEELKKKVKSKNLLVIIGGEKVPRCVYELADYNISITTQPHSEVAALAVFLHELFEGKEFHLEFENAKLKIVPQERGKKVVRVSNG